MIIATRVMMNNIRTIKINKNVRQGADVKQKKLWH
jgi:hypothetical protein